MNDYDAVSDSSSVKIFVNYEKSKGNYIVDADNNIILDMISGGGHLPLGYNHNSFIKTMDSKIYDKYLQNTISFSFFPPIEEAIDFHERLLLRVVPHESLKQVHLYPDISGGLANENAIKAAMIRHHHTKCDAHSTHHDSFHNPNHDYQVISFAGSNHGNTFGTLSLSNHPQKINLPMKNWTVLDFPEDHEDEARVLENFEHSIKSQSGSVACVIIEPLQSLTYEHACPDFYNQLRNIAHEHDVAFIVDETSTGCGASGTFWAHEQWKLDREPDIVTFGKRTQSSGFYTREDFVPKDCPWELFKLTAGDGVKLLQMRNIIEVIKKDHLLDKVKQTGENLRKSLETVDGITNVRGLGNMIAFDTPSMEANVKLLRNLKSSGVNIAAAGVKSIATKPALIFEEKHSKEFLSVLKKSIR